jgi:hypothetical protein
MKRGAVLAAFLWGAAAVHAQPGVEATSPTLLNQYQSNGYSFPAPVTPTWTETITGTTVAQGGTNWTTSIVLQARVHGSDTDVSPSAYLHRVRVEVRPTSDPLIGVYTHEGITTEMRPDAPTNFSDAITGGNVEGRTSYITIVGLLPGVAYHWQAMSWKT